MAICTSMSRDSGLGSWRIAARHCIENSLALLLREEKRRNGRVWCLKHKEPSSVLPALQPSYTPKAQPTHSEMKLPLEMQMTHRGLRDSCSCQVKWGFEGHLGASCIQPGEPPGLLLEPKVIQTPNRLGNLWSNKGTFSLEQACSVQNNSQPTELANG